MGLDGERGYVAVWGIHCCCSDIFSRSFMIQEMKITNVFTILLEKN